MGYWFMSFLAVFFPWIVLLINDNPGGALVALIMQTTLFGWIPASLWALRVVRENYKEKKADKLEKKARKARQKSQQRQK